jgi:hypothetical protein
MDGDYAAAVNAVVRLFPAPSNHHHKHHKHGGVVTQNIISFVRATTRPFVTYTLTGTLVYCVVAGLIDAKEIVTPTAMVLAFWFGSRTAKTDTEVVK